MSAPTRGSWTAVGLTLLFGVCQLDWAVGNHASASAVVLAPLGLLAAAALARLNCVEARLAVVVVVTGAFLLTVLALTVGLPGEPRHPLDLTSLLGLVIPIAVVIAIDADRRIRRRRARSSDARADDLYAR